MHPDSAKEAVLLAKRTEKAISKSKNDIIIAPPFPFLAAAKKVIKRAKLGAQDDFWNSGGAHTGKVSPTMLKNSGVKYVIIGHSECRAIGETDEMINKKVKATLKAKLKPVLCVGEHLETRKKGMAAAKNFVKTQLKKDLKGVSSGVIIAYEPIWAISTNKNAQPDKPENSLEMIKFIKFSLATKPYTLYPKVLYGGSVTSKNAKSFLQYKEIDGALVGGASLKPDEFGKIANL